MEWVSPDVELFYKILNKAYTTIMMHTFPYVKKVSIDPKSFNDAFLEDKWSNDISIFMCADFLSKEYNEKDEDKELGTEVNSLLRTLIKMVPYNHVLGERKFYPSLQLNYTDYCEGIVEYTR